MAITVYSRVVCRIFDCDGCTKLCVGAECNQVNCYRSISEERRLRSYERGRWRWSKQNQGVPWDLESSKDLSRRTCRTIRYKGLFQDPWSKSFTLQPLPMHWQNLQKEDPVGKRFYSSVKDFPDLFFVCCQIWHYCGECSRSVEKGSKGCDICKVD